LNPELTLMLVRRASEFVPKGPKDSARGFNPWQTKKKRPALKGRKIGIQHLIWRRNVRSHIFCHPVSIPNPLSGCNSDSAQYSNTRLLHHSA